MPADRVHAWAARRRWLAGWVLGCALAACTAGMAQAQERVLLLAPDAPEPLLLELYHRLEAELRIHGFDTVTLVGSPDASARGNLGAQASARQALAAIAVVMRNKSAALDVWIVDRSSGQVSLRSLTANAGDETANLVAVRAVDLLRAILAARSGKTEPRRPQDATVGAARPTPPPAAQPGGTALSVVAPESTSAPHTEEAPRSEREEAQAPRRREPPWSVRAEAFGLWQGARFDVALGPALSARYCPISRLCVSAVAVGAFGLSRFQTTLGSARLRQQLFFAELELPLLASRTLQLSAAAGGGVMLLEAQGHATPPLVSQNATLWSWTAAAGPRLTYDLDAHWSLTATARVRLFLPDVVIAVATESAKLAVPAVDAALGLALAL